MKITIDTKEDSHSEIRRAIKMLSSLIGDPDTQIYTNSADDIPKQRNTNIFDDPSPELAPASQAPAQTASQSAGQESNAFASMFGDTTPAPTTAETSAESDTQTAEEEKPEDENPEDEKPPQVQIIDY